MLRNWLLLLFGLAAGAVGAQRLDVRVPESAYVGDAFTLEVALDGAALEGADFAFDPAVRVVGQSRVSTSVNGRTRASLTWRLLAERPGPCRLARLVATTADGREIVCDEHPVVQIRELALDPAVSLALTAEPDDPLPGDDVRLTLTVRAPALAVGGQRVSPFLSADLFGRLTPRAPRAGLDFRTDESSPLRQTSRPEMGEPTFDGTNLVWAVTVGYRAVRAGEQLFPAPLIRDERAAAVDGQGRVSRTRCLAIGKPLTVTVTDPPLEGRPRGYIGAIGRSFRAEAALDALNVSLGDPVRLTLTFLADCDPALLRAPSLPEIPGFRAYGEPTRRTVEGGCAFDLNLRPVRAGLAEIPALTFAWFDREARAYRTDETAPIPIRVRPSAQLALVGPDGVALGEPPPALVHEAPPERPARWPWIVAAAGTAALLCRLFLAALRLLWRVAAAPFLKARPAREALATLARTQDPAEAAEAVRRWAGRPALTPGELRALLPETPEAAAVVDAFATLEGRAYTHGGDAPDARDTLRHLLPRFAEAVRRATLIVLALVPVGLSAAGSGADAFRREEAWARAVAAVEPADHARAANLWIEVAEAGGRDRAALQNAAVCAFMAGRPEATVTLLCLCERLHGRDATSAQGLRAAASRLGRPEPSAWARLRWTLPAHGALVALGVACLFLAVTHPRRLLAPKAACLLAAAVLAAWAAIARHGARTEPLPGPIVAAAQEGEPQTEEATP